ncbi:DUF5309 family protein [Paracoccus sp. (in: a-proteobacteria)]|uniref:SU10 major capsid protein n=1 Tax=Paracoccus sp. TaxID=267 RepID=UPI00333F2077
MPVNTNALEVYDSSTIREDLQEAFVSISPTDTPFTSAIGKGKATNTYHEWHETDLAAVNTTNRTYYGDPAPANDAPTLAVRKGNYIQLSDKVVEITSTAEAVKGAANIETMSRQVAFKLKELKRDMEAMSLANIAAASGSSGTAAASAGLPAFLMTNVARGAGGANGATSGSGTDGYVNTAATDGTLRALTEPLLQGVIAQCWESGAEPTMIMVGALVKQKISTFTHGGAIDRTAVASKKELPTAIDVYISDFGTLQIVPNRFQRARDVFVLDPEYIRQDFLTNVKQEPLAKTGHSDRKLISAHWTLVVESQKAQGIVADINGAL